MQTSNSSCDALRINIQSRGVALEDSDGRTRRTNEGIVNMNVSKQRMPVCTSVLELAPVANSGHNGNTAGRCGRSIAMNFSVVGSYVREQAIGASGWPLCCYGKQDALPF
jgi:hypothetical protein